MKIFTLLLGVMVVCTVQLHATDELNDSEFFLGTVYLKNGKVIHGKIKHELNPAIIILKRQNIAQAFTPQLVSSFQYFDEKTNKVKKFISLYKETKDRGYYRRVFFEVLVPGEINLLKTSRKILNPESNKSMRYKQDREKYIFLHKYFLLSNEKLVNIKNFEKQMESVLGEDLFAVKEFIKEEELTLNGETAYIKVLNYYNQISN
ncbi:hypothetical protein [Flexithrix dorotheae]|uniref:hypothetical protein n=1 Tax=Flexithrix dorotheae TaxID=70993 RepID=UPI0003715BE4|nr:hypothetical protein [Flexithrix dorotheae]